MKSTSCLARLALGMMGFEALNLHLLLALSLLKHVHLGVLHVQFIIHDGIILFGCFLL